MKSITLVLLQLCCWQAFAHVPEDGDIHATLAPSLVDNLPHRHQFESPFLAGMALIAEGDIDNHGGVEITAMYMYQLYSIKRGDQLVTEKGRRMFISTGYRHWFVPKFSVALAFDSSFAMGEGEIVHNDFGINNSPATSAQSSVTYGFDLSVQYEPFHWGRYAMTVDGRYAYCITNKPQEDSNVVFFMVGLKYFVQSREEGLRNH